MEPFHGVWHQVRSKIDGAEPEESIKSISQKAMMDQFA
jgi:hypothetical protein